MYHKPRLFSTSLLHHIILRNETPKKNYDINNFVLANTK